MNRTYLIIVAAGIVVLGAGVWAMRAMQTDGGGNGAGGYFDAAAPADERVAALERIVAEERAARLVLEEQLQGLYAELERLNVPELQSLLDDLQRQAARQPPQEAGIVDPRQYRRLAIQQMRDFADMRRRKLVQGGFSEAQAAQLLELEDRLRMDALQAEYDARRHGEPYSPWQQANDVQTALRDKLGDADYEKYLTANNGTASIVVGQVLASSPASRAGLQPGDQIVSYDGNRVFSLNELRAMAFEGDPGEDVIVDIERDGQRMQLVLPRGPLGINGGGGMMFGPVFGAQ